MKTASKHSIYVIVLGIIVAICLIASNIQRSPVVASAKNNKDMLDKYRSAIPLVTTPLQILAKGLNIVNNE